MPPSIPPSSHGTVSQGWPPPSGASPALPVRPSDVVVPSPRVAGAQGPAPHPPDDGVHWSPAALLLARLQSAAEGARQPAHWQVRPGDTGHAGATVSLPTTVPLSTPLPTPGSPQARELAQALLQRLGQIAVLAGVRPPTASTFVVEGGRIGVAAGWPDPSGLLALMAADPRMQTLVRALHAVTRRADGDADAEGIGPGGGEAHAPAPPHSAQVADAREAGPLDPGITGLNASAKSAAHGIALLPAARDDGPPDTGDPTAGDSRRDRVPAWVWPMGWTDGRRRDAGPDATPALRYWSGAVLVLGALALWWWLAG